MYSILTKQNNFNLLRKYVVVFTSLLLFIGGVIYMNPQMQPPIMYINLVDDNIVCHYVNENDALPSAEDKNFLPTPNSIFFHETSCRGGLNSRQACAIESASRAHPRRQVYVMFSAPVSEAVYQRSSIAKLRRFANIKFARIHIGEYARNTPLEAMVASAPFNKSHFPLEHTSDILRYLTLYKWGGVYLDTDMLVVKSLTPLGNNWVAKQDSSFVNAAAIAISTDQLGRKLVEAVMNELKTTYRPDIWVHNGPGAITRVLRKMCTTKKLAKWSSKTCQGLEVYSPEYFFPLHYSLKHKYFTAGEKNSKDAYTHHFWNKLTYNMKIEKDSPYEKMAQKYCPTIYEMYGQGFGL
ncbi:hypothetical protein PYW08_016782 [Mythimna loreyi]|uniref:Uncharacterized protein n=1 Tax=Mythimna loreyi TaxID=667449 RepID=A0ACC2QYD4_9NEOP|nr:hypothetical protein PYW08_016782 [Mythimna loreyi]